MKRYLSIMPWLVVPALLTAPACQDDEKKKDPAPASPLPDRIFVKNTQNESQWFNAANNASQILTQSGQNLRLRAGAGKSFAQPQALPMAQIVTHAFRGNAPSDQMPDPMGMVVPNCQNSASMSDSYEQLTTSLRDVFFSVQAGALDNMSGFERAEPADGEAWAYTFKVDASDLGQDTASYPTAQLPPFNASGRLAAYGNDDELLLRFDMNVDAKAEQGDAVSVQLAFDAYVDTKTKTVNLRAGMRGGDMSMVLGTEARAVEPYSLTYTLDLQGPDPDSNAVHTVATRVTLTQVDAHTMRIEGTYKVDEHAAAFDETFKVDTFNIATCDVGSDFELTEKK